jgi:hypothetical protein
MKKFLQEGLNTYAPALLALSEFRRQIRSRLQSVLEEFSIQFSGLGISVADLKPDGPKLDDHELDETSSWIGLQKNHGAELYTACNVEWNLGNPKGEQVWVSIWIYVGIRSDRDRLFGALQKQRSPSSKADLERYSNGTSALSSYCDSDRFHSFDQTFRTLVEEWVELLSGVGGVQPFLSAAAVSRLYSRTTSEEP